MAMLKDFLVVTMLVLLFILLSWSYGRALSGGRQLNPVKRRILTYASVFALGMMYLMVFVSDLGWPQRLMFPMIAIWGAAVGLVAWRRHRRQAHEGQR